MQALFDINNIAFSILNYPISYVELLGTIFGLLGVFFASRSHVITWPTGLINIVFFFALFYQYQLYADMFLQVYFFAINVYGWLNWKKAQNSSESFTLFLNKRQKIIILSSITLLTFPVGYLVSNLHEILPSIFTAPAKAAYLNSFIMVASIFANTLLAKRYIESWYLWILVDIICVGLYFQQGIYFLTLEYLLFLVIAIYAVYAWRKKI